MVLYTVSEPSVRFNSMNQHHIFGPKIYKYIIKMIKNATMPNNLASTTIVTTYEATINF